MNTTNTTPCVAVAVTLHGEIPLNEFAPNRPGERDPRVIRAVAERLLGRVNEWLGDDADDSTLDQLVELLDGELDWDGYALANRLERGWSPDSALVDILDSASGYRSAAKTALVRQWVKDNDIRLTCQIGQQATHDLNGEKHVGEITKLYPDLAQVLLFVESEGHVRDGIGSHGFIIDAERAFKEKVTRPSSGSASVRSIVN